MFIAHLILLGLSQVLVRKTLKWKCNVLVIKSTEDYLSLLWPFTQFYPSRMSANYGRLPTDSQDRRYHDEAGMEENTFVNNDVVRNTSKEERRRLWWWNAGINMIFISLW